MNKLSRLLTIVALLLASFSASAQMVNVTGQVVDAATGAPMPNISILSSGILFPLEKHYKTSTGKDGTFTLTMYSGDILHIGADQNHHPLSVVIENHCSVEVTLPVNHRDISEYDYVGEERFGWRLVRSGGKSGFINTEGTEVVPLRYDEVCEDYPGNFSMIRVRVGDRYGYVDYLGREVYHCIYEEASLPYMIGCDLSRVMYDGKYGFVGIHNSFPCTLDNAEERLIYSYSPETMEIDYSRGYAKVWDDTGMVGYINQDAELEGRLVYDDIIWNYFSDEPLWVRRDGKYYPAGTIHPDMVVKSYDYATAFEGQKFAVVGEIYRKASGAMRYGYANRQGVLVIPLIYDAAYPFREGYAAVVKDGKLGFIDESGAVAVPFGDYEYFGDFSEGLAAVKKDGKIGFIDIKGKNVIPCRYEGAGHFESGSTIARMKGKWGLIDKRGKALTKFIYNTMLDAVDRLHLKKPDGSVVYLDAEGNEYPSLKKRQQGILRTDFKEGYEYLKVFLDVAKDYANGYSFEEFDDSGMTHSTQTVLAPVFAEASRGNLFCRILSGIYLYEDGDFVEAHNILSSAQSELKLDPDVPFTMDNAIKRLLSNIMNKYLGDMYLFGNGVPQDYQKAASYLAKSQYDDAPYLLAQMAERGLGMDVDLIKARHLYDWYFRQTGYRESWKSAHRMHRMLEYESSVASKEGVAGKPEESKKVVDDTPKVILPKMKKIALVIGNSDYTYGSFLANPVNDAEDLSFKLEELGFDVMKGIDLTEREIMEKVDEFAVRTSQYDIALFYYAGHGIQSAGTNYLIPVDVSLKSETDVQYDCVNVNRVLSRLEEEDCKMKIIILDACRNNPFERAWNRSMDKRGLAMMDAPVGTFIAFSTAPGSVAKDGSGNNSPYADALLKVLEKPGLNIHDVFQDVHDIVVENTGKEQHPWTSSSLTGRLYLNDKL